jgi:hypothetical protein
LLVEKPFEGLSQDKVGLLRACPFKGSATRQRKRQQVGRGSRIRTCGPLLPKQVLYQAELCPDIRRIKNLEGQLASRFYMFSGKFYMFH